MKLTGAEIFVECLKREGVKTIFGLPGGVVLKIFDVLHQQKDIEVILTRHEAGAGHMAEGYAKATGKPGVALVTSGPGMTNVVTPLVDAYMDSVPIVVFTGQVPTHLIGNDAFQEADNVGISRPCTKYNFLVKDVNDLGQIIKEAFYIAMTGRPGPVLVDIPKDVAMNKGEIHYPDRVSIRGYNPTYEGNKWQIKQAVEAIHKHVHVDIPIVGDVKPVLRERKAMLKATPNGNAVEQGKPWWNQINEWKAKHPLTYEQPPDALIKPQYVIDRIYQFTKDKDPIVSTDVGQHQMWAAQHFVLNKPRRWLTSGGLGTMGFGMPAALGAQAAFRDKLVLCIAGDGSFQMNMQEMATAVVNKLPVKVFILNNHFHGMVRQWQDPFHEGRYAPSSLDTVPDFVKLAEAFNAVGLRATKVGEVDGVIKEALKVDKPVIVDLEVDPYENCYPMIPAGGSNHEMIIEDPPEMKRGEKPASKVAGEDKDAVLTA